MTGGALGSSGLVPSLLRAWAPAEEATLRRGLATLVTRMLGSGLCESVMTRLASDRLRILAYHGIDDVAAFAAQMRHLADSYNPVTREQVVATASEGGALPDRAVWITFDDGHPEVIELGQPLLDSLGIQATMFVCPGLVDTSEPYWWEVLEAAVEGGLPVFAGGRRWTDQRLVTYAKALPDAERRMLVEQTTQQLAGNTGRPMTRRRTTSARLLEWARAGHGVGNHTWDHPCLDTCSPQEQRQQVERAQGWLSEHFPDDSVLFSYPNGNWTPETDSVLRACGTQIGLLFDHRLTRADSPPLRWSRLRVSAGAPLHRFRSIVSGAHSAAFQALRTARR